MDAVSRGRFLRMCEDEDVVATVLLAAVVMEYGVEVFDWDPSALWMTIEEDLRVEPGTLGALARARIQCLVAVHGSDLVGRQWEVFEKTCTELTRARTSFSIVDAPTPSEVAWTIVELALNGVTPAWSSEVSAYARRVFYDYGFYRVPEYLSFTKLADRARRPESAVGVDLATMEAEQASREADLAIYVTARARLLAEQAREYLGSCPHLALPNSINLTRG